MNRNMGVGILSALDQSFKMRILEDRLTNDDWKNLTLKANRGGLTLGDLKKIIKEVLSSESLRQLIFGEVV